MKLRDLIAKVDRSKNNESHADIDEFCQALGIDECPGWVEEFDTQVKSYSLIKWLCTDTHVGLNVYYFNDKPVAISTQTGRKMGVDIEFVSVEAATIMKDFIISRINIEFNPTITDLDYEMEDHYTVSYHAALLVDKGFYGGQEVEVVRRKEDYSEHVDEWCKVDVKLRDGTVKRIQMAEFKIPYHLALG